MDAFSVKAICCHNRTERKKSGMQAFVFEETMEIPTYAVGQPDKNPLFLENRVYQGSSGKVYPFPVIDKIYDQKVKKSYRAVILENEYLKITFLPELGGRVYRAVDKTNGYDFVYCNEVIKPALVGLLTAVHMLRASGLLDWLAQALSPVLHLLGIPPETVGLMLIRPISGSGALGVGSELIQRYGPDSLIGRTAAVMLGSTETTFYTIAVYFGAAGIRNTRYAIPAALCADLCGFVAASWAVRLFFGG